MRGSRLRGFWLRQLDLCWYALLLRHHEAVEEPRLQADLRRHRERKADHDGSSLHLILRSAVGGANPRRRRNLRRVFSHHLANPAAGGYAPLRDAAAMAHGSGAKWIGDLVHAVGDDPGRYLRTVAAHEPVRPIVVEVDLLGHRHPAIRVGAVANDPRSIGEDA